MKGLFDSLVDPEVRRRSHRTTPADCKTCSYFIGSIGPTIFVVISMATGKPMACRETLAEAQTVMTRLQASLDTRKPYPFCYGNPYIEDCIARGYCGREIACDN